MEIKPIISAIIVTYGSNDWLLRTIDSVLEQRQENIELIVSDDGSNKFDLAGVIGYIEKKKKNNISSYKVFAYEQNVGTVKNINRALKQAEGKYIKLIGGDDVYYDEEVFSTQISYLENNPDKMLVTGFSQQCDLDMNHIVDVRVSNTNEALESIFNMSAEEAFAFYLHKEYSPLVTQATCFRKEFFENYGYYDERFALIEDSPMGAFVILNGIPVGVQRLYVVKHRMGNGISSGEDVFSVKRLNYYRDVLLYAELFLVPNKNILGNRFVDMKYNISQFRVEYCVSKMNNDSIWKKISIIIRNSKSILFYLAYTPKKALNKLKGIMKH